MKIICIHPDLGIGGAERLIIDIGLSLKRSGHTVEYLTSHHDPTHCFPETNDQSFKVSVVGDWLPRSILGACIALCAYFRMIFIAFCLVLKQDFSSQSDCDLIICDQVSAHIPVLIWLYQLVKGKRPKILFYCHFPDQLLTDRTHLLKKFYRYPLDWLEEKTTGMADLILVNSNFTAGIFRKTFKSLSKIDLKVLYPICNFSNFDKPIDRELAPLIPAEASSIFISINRYERKKNISLCLKALAILKNALKKRAENSSACHLIVAGGYDERVSENVEHYMELINLSKVLGIFDQVTFLKSPSDDTKRTLLYLSTALLYSPANEHFGIVPLEAMYMKKPVIACNSGGPLETVIDSETGFLCNSNPESFAEKMLLFVKDKNLSTKLGKKGRDHVSKNFSSKSFDTQLDIVISNLINMDS